MSKIQFLIIIIIVSLTISCTLFDDDDPKTEDIYGCLDSTATNYNPEATIDDGNCDYCKAGASFLLISTDGGATWDFNCPQNFDISSAFQISIIDTNNIWIGCDQEGEENQPPFEAILYSSDQGRSWEIRQTILEDFFQGGGTGLQAMLFIDKNNGLSVVDETNGQVFYRTYNGGINWQTIATPPTEGKLIYPVSIDIINLQILYYVNDYISPNILYGTINLGAPWDTTHFQAGYKILDFYDEQIGLIADNVSIHRTVDQGKTWQTFPQPFFNNSFFGQGVRFSNTTPRDVWLLDYRNIHFSADTGRTWLSYPYDDDVAADMYIYDNEAWIVGSATVFYSSDASKGGWTAVTFPNQPHPIRRVSGAISGIEDKVIVLTGSF